MVGNKYNLKGNALKGSSKLPIENEVIQITLNAIGNNSNINDATKEINEKISKLLDSNDYDLFCQTNKVKTDKIDTNQPQYTALKQFCKEQKLKPELFSKISYIIKEDKSNKLFEKSVEISIAKRDNIKIDLAYYKKRIIQKIDGIYQNVLNTPFNGSLLLNDISLPIMILKNKPEDIIFKEEVFDNLKKGLEQNKDVNKLIDNHRDTIVEENTEEKESYNIEDFKYIETGYGYKEKEINPNAEIRRRQYITDEEMDKFVEERDNTDIYKSAFHYNAQEVVGKYTPKVGDVYFDFDVKEGNLNERLEQSKKASLKLVEYFKKKFDIDPTCWKFRFSGNQGTHCLLDYEYFGLQPSRYYEVIISELTTRLNSLLFKKDIVKIDDNIQKWDQFLGVVNSIHPKSGLFRIPFTYEELLKEDFPEFIIKEASCKRELKPNSATIKENKLLNGYMQPIIRKASNSYKIGKLMNPVTNRNFYKKEKLGDLLPCVKENIIPKLQRGESMGFEGRQALIYNLTHQEFESEEERDEKVRSIFTSFKHPDHQKSYMREYNTRSSYFEKGNMPCETLRNEHGVCMNKQCINCPKMQYNELYDDKCEKTFELYQEEARKENVKEYESLNNNHNKSVVVEQGIASGKTYNMGKYASKNASSKKVLLLAPMKETSRELFKEIDTNECSVLFEGIKSEGMCTKSGKCKGCKFNLLEKKMVGEGNYIPSHKNYSDVNSTIFEGKIDTERAIELIEESNWEVCPRKLLQYIIKNQAQIVIHNSHFLFIRDYERTIGFQPDIILIDEFHQLIDLLINKNNNVFPIATTSTTLDKVHYNKCSGKCENCTNVLTCGSNIHTPYNTVEKYREYIYEGIDYLKTSGLFNEELVDLGIFKENVDKIIECLKDLKTQDMKKFISTKEAKFKEQHKYEIKKNGAFVSERFEQIYDLINFKPCVNKNAIEDIDAFDGKYIKNSDWFKDGQVKGMDNDKRNQVRDLKKLIEITNFAGDNKIESLLTYSSKTKSVPFCHINLLVYDKVQHNKILSFLNKTQFYATSGTNYDQDIIKGLFNNENIEFKTFETKAPKNMLLLHHEYQKNSKVKPTYFYPCTTSEENIISIIKDSGAKNVLIFANNKNQANIMKNVCDDQLQSEEYKTITTDYSKIKKSYKLFQDKDERKGVLITYIRSDLNTGKNLPTFDLIIVKANGFSEYSDFMAFAHFLESEKRSSELKENELEYNPEESKRHLLGRLLQENRKNCIIQATLRNHRNSDMNRVSIIITDINQHAYPDYLRNRVGLGTFFYKINKKEYKKMIVGNLDIKENELITKFQVKTISEITEKFLQNKPLIETEKGENNAN